MANKLLQFFDSIFPVRPESETSAAAQWLDRVIYAFILLLAVAAPISIAATNAGWIGALFFSVIRFFVRPRPLYFRTPVDLPIFAFFGWCLLSSIFSYAPDLSLDRLRVLTLFPILYVVAQNIRTAKTVKFLAGALIFAALVTVAWTFAERGIGRGVQVFELDPNGILAKNGIQNGDTLLKIDGKRFRAPETLTDALQFNETTKVNVYRPDYYFDAEIKQSFSPSATVTPEMLGYGRWQTGRNWRSAGFFGHYTTYAEILQLVLSLIFGIFLVSLRNKKRFLPLLIALAATGIALLLTTTRASQAAFLVSAFVIAVLHFGLNRRTLLILFAAFVPLVIVAALFLQSSRNTQFVDARDGSTTWRTTVWREGAELLIKSPRHLLLGVGIDSVKRYKCEWGLFDNCRLPPGHFHSTPLQIAVECGIPALLLWLFFVWRYGAATLAAIRQSNQDSLEKGILLGAFGGLIGFFAGGAVHYNLGDSEVAMVFYLIAGLSLVLIRSFVSNQTTSNNRSM